MSPFTGVGPRAALFVLVCLSSGTALGGCAAVHDERRCAVHACSPDAQITAAVHERLQAHGTLLLDQLSVQTRHSTVYLGGRVLTEAQKDAAGEIARATPGVVSVSNDLLVEEDTGD